jgi:amidohydrolase
VNSALIGRDIEAAVDALRDRAISVSRQIHDNPELGFQEHRASTLLAEWLRDEGFAVETGSAGLTTAFVASYGSGAPRIAVMAEYDALPGLGHGCAHNLIAAGGVTAGIAIKRAMTAARLPGTLLVIGTPGEEGQGGKVTMLERGVFDGVQAALMFHPSDRTFVDRHMLACIHVNVSFRGVAAHAAKNPQDGRNALAAMIAFFNGIDALRQHISPRARIHGVITNGGAAANVIPDHTQAEFYVRDATLAEASVLLERVRACADGAALMTGTEVDVESSAPYAQLSPNRTMAGVMATYLTALGYPPGVASPTDAAGSTDAGNVSLALPTIHPFIQIAPVGTPLHSTDFREAAVTRSAHEAMLAASCALAAVGLDLITDPDLLKRAAAEFSATAADELTYAGPAVR